MGLTVRQVVESITTHGIMPASELQSLREKAQAEIDNDAEPLLRDLTRQNKLTKFQATNIYGGRAKGLVFGEYLILDKIGAGGMGQVYKAQHRRMKRIVALKVLPPQSVGSQKAVQRFYQEVEVAAKLMHPNVVTAYDAGEAHGMLYLVMEFVDGKDLSSYVAKHGPLSLEQTLNVVLQAAKGLAYAHGLGIVHRDIKPSNLLVNRDKVVKILDMGLARAADPVGGGGPVGAELTASGEVMGTMDYMAPEQAVDTRTADHRADIYALGCTLYRLYIGKPPYSGETAVQKILAHRDKPIPSLQAERPETPDMVERLYKKMMAKRLEDRTPTMAAVVQSIENMLSGVDEERSSVMLGAEPVEDDGTFMPSGAIVGGSSLGNLPGSSAPGLPVPGMSGPGLPGQSHISKGKAAGSSIGGAAAGQPALPQINTASKTSTSKAPTAQRIRANDTDAEGPTAATGATAARTAAKPGAAATSTGSKSKSMLIGGAAAAVLVGGVAAFFALRGKQDDPAPGNPTPGNPATAAVGQPTSTKPAASASPSPTMIASLPQPSASPSASRPAIDFFGLPTPTPSGTDASPTATTNPPPNPGPYVPAPPVAPTPQSELTAEIDLLASIDPTKHSRRGSWVRRNNEVVLDPSGSNSPHYIDVPFAPPEEYDLTCTAVPPPNSFGPGIVLGGHSCGLWVNERALGVSMVDGLPGIHGNNPTYRTGRFYGANVPVTIVCAVRRNRLVVILDGRQLLDVELSSKRIAFDDPTRIHPGQLFLQSYPGIRYTGLKIGPPQLSLPPPSTPVNLAAAFDQANVVEGVAAQRRGEVQLTSQDNAHGKLQFTQPRGEAYLLRAVVEPLEVLDRENGVIFGLPVGGRRTGVSLDFGVDRWLGLQVGPGGYVSNNPSGRREGLLLPPGEQHVVEIRVAPELNGHRFQTLVDGREWINFVTNDYNWNAGYAVPDQTSVAPIIWDGNLRIVRFDQLPADGRRLPVPDTTARAKAAETVRGLSAQADAKNAPLDAKLLAVDLLRKKAATELSDPALRYEALDAAIRIAAAAGDLAGTYEAVEDLVTTFDVDPRGFHPKILETFRLPRTAAAAKQQFADEVLKLTARAARSEQFELALDLNSALDKFLGSTNNDAKREIKARAVEYELARSLQGPATEARAKLAGGENDPAAHLALGLYLACGRGDWLTGLKELAQGADTGLQAAAALEQGDLTTGDLKFALADKWLDLSDKEKTPALKWTYTERAALWYRRSAMNVADAKRPILQRQMSKIAQTRKASNGAGGPRRPLDAVKIGDHWYRLYALPMHWDSAVASCENWGGNLLVVDNAAENQAVAQYVLQKLSSSGKEQTTVWQGANDFDKEGTFRRLDGVTLPVVPPAYFTWRGGEPNNANGDEDYVATDYRFSAGQVTIEWYDIHRGAYCYTVCEWDH